MKAVVLTGIRQMEIQDWPDPVIDKPTDVLLKIEQVGVCGSDVHYYETGRIGSQVVKFPYIVGHECAATVVDVGSDVKSVKKGDQVVIEPAVSCHDCEQCNKGRENTCYNLSFLGTPGQGYGCLCEYMVMPEECCLPTRGRLSIAQGVLCEPLAIAVYAVRQSGLSQGDDIAILGAGPIGLSCLLGARAAGVGDCYMTEKIDARVEIARRNGATWVGNPDKQNVVGEIGKHKPLGVDIAFECAGQQETIDQAVELLAPGGKLMLIGIPREDRVSFPIDKMRRKEITIVNVRRQNDCTQDTMDLVASGRIEPDFMVTHRFGMERSREAFDMVAGYKDGVVKALIEF